MKSLALAGFGAALPPGEAAPVVQQTFDTLPPWTPGTLDIHHISTGRGNAAFVVCPDATTVLIDAGAQNAAPGWKSDERFLIQPKPDASKRPGQWIAEYILRAMPAHRSPAVDYFILTHLHTDHMGAVNLLPHTPALSTRPSHHGRYELTGVSDVYERLPIRTILDRAWPDYSYPVALDDPHQKNYRAFLQAFVTDGGTVERFVPGRADQVKLRFQPAMYPSFSVRNLAANGRVWTGVADQALDTFPALSTLAQADYPTENKCSLGLLLHFDAFRYFSAGDMDHDTRYGGLPWADIESRVAAAAGPVDVAIANHHGYANACGPQWVRSLRPKAFVISAWDSAHPTIPSLDNMLSADLYPGERAVYATALKPENVIATKRLHEIKSGNGHVVVRALPGTPGFQIFVTSNQS